MWPKIEPKSELPEWAFTEFFGWHFRLRWRSNIWFAGALVSKIGISSEPPNYVQDCSWINCIHISTQITSFELDGTKWKGSSCYHCLGVRTCMRVCACMWTCVRVCVGDFLGDLLSSLQSCLGTYYEWLIIILTRESTVQLHMEYPTVGAGKTCPLPLSG